MPTPQQPSDAGLVAFIARWDGTGMAERANYARFLDELCDVLGVSRPDPASGSGGPYRYERGVLHHDTDDSTTNRRIDLYKRGCFVLEAKQGSNPPRQQSLFGTAEAERRANVRRSPGWAQQAVGWDALRIPPIHATAGSSRFPALLPECRVGGMRRPSHPTGPYPAASAASTIRAPRASNAERLACARSARLSKRATNPSSMVTLMRTDRPPTSTDSSTTRGS